MAGPLRCLRRVEHPAEEAGLAAARGPGPAPASGRRVEFVDLQGSSAPPPRTRPASPSSTGCWAAASCPASAVLVGGDPGIGKSTILLQAAARIAAAGHRALYISGEEAIEQVRLRALRLGLAQAPLALAAATALRDIVASLEQNDAALVVIDCIQTMWLDARGQRARHRSPRCAPAPPS